MATETTSEDRPLRADAERNRQRILDAAAELLAERGLSVSMDEIADRAGVGVGTVYRRFPDREQLIDALFEQKFGQMVAIADEAVAHEDAWEGLRYFVESSSALHARDRGLREAIFSDATGREKIAATRGQIQPRVAKLVARAKEEGKLRGDLATLDVPAISMMIASVLDFTGEVRPDHWRRMLDIVFDGLAASRDQPSELTVDPLEREEFERALAGWRSPRR